MYFIFIDWTDLLKILIPTSAALLVLWFQLERNKSLQAEGTFFNLLNSIRNLVSTTSGTIYPEKHDVFTNTEENKVFGLDYFYNASEELHGRLRSALGKAAVFDTLGNKKGKEFSSEVYDITKKTYDKFFKENLPELSHYFRFTFNVLKFVNTSPNIPKEKKVEYINLIQAQMSDSELQLLFFNGIGQHGKKFYDLIEKYNFLQNIDSSKNQELFDTLDIYPKSDFR